MPSIQKVIALQDGDSHWYVIPADQLESFRVIEEECDKIDDYEKFEESFGKYRTGGDLNIIQLYAEI